jgi:branched-subunit amino acid aminotransferase/4-amino-4-deoxychorismate lyase
MVAAYGGGMAHATVNGVPATLDDLVPLAFAGYGHYSSMQVRDGRVRGLHLHLRRLREASAELFGVPVPDERVREYIRATVIGDASVEVYMFGSASVDSGAPVEPSVLVRATDPVHPSPTPVGVRTVRFGRWLPEVKNLARMGAVHLRRQARVDGFDDVLFVGDDGLVAEGSTWNVLFLDADGATVFPVAPMLTGTTVQLIRAGLPSAAPAVDRPVHVDELGALRGAAWTSSNNPARPIAAVDGVAVPVDEEWLATLRAAFSENVPEVV